MAYDLPLILDALADNAEAVCRRYLPAGQRQGNYWTVGDVHNAAGRSMWVRLNRDASGRPPGKWQDAATGDHGDLLDVIRETCRLTSFGEILQEARGFLSLPDEQPRPAGSQADRRTSTPGDRRASRLFSASRPLRHTLAEQYLRARGLTNCEAFTALRFHPHCYYAQPDGVCLSLPALIAAVTNDDGRLTGVLRTFLDADGFAGERLGKAPVDTPRKAMGDLLGHAVRFGQPGTALAAGEGIETVLSLRTVAPTLPLAAALSAGHLAAFTLPPLLRRLYVIRDNDAGGRWATSRLTQRAIEAGIEAIVIAPVGNDLNEDLRRQGPQGLLATVRDQFRDEDRRQYLQAQ